MAIGYTWDCKTCDTHPSKSGKSNVVWNVHWRLKATDNSNNDSEIKILKKILNECIDNEKYESAAIIRDKIKKITK